MKAQSSLQKLHLIIMQKKNKAVQANFVFTIKQVWLRTKDSGNLKVCIRRKDKAAVSRDYPYNSQTANLQINQKVQFPTTVEQDQQRNDYKSKTATLQLTLSQGDGKVYEAFTDIELTEFIGSEPLTRRLKLQGDIDLAQIQFNCMCSLPIGDNNQFKSMANTHIDGTEVASRNEIIQVDKSQKTIGLVPRKKEKTLLFIPEALASQDSTLETHKFKTTDGSQVKRTLKRALTNVPYTPIAARQFSFGAQQLEKQLKSSKPQPLRAKTPQRVKVSTTAKIQDSSPKHQDTPNGVPSNNNFKSATSIDCKIEDNSKEIIRRLNDQVKRLEKECKSNEESNVQLSRKIKELTEKTQLMESSERNTQEGNQKILKRLYEDIDNKNKQIKSLETQVQQQRLRIKTQEEDNIALKKELSGIKLQRQKLLFDIRLKGNDSVGQNVKDEKKYQRQIQNLRRDYQEEIKELKHQIKLNTVSITQTTASCHQVCLSRDCQTQKKELKAKVKQLTKNIEEKQKQMETKERLLKSYDNIKNDREMQNLPINLNKQMEKWRAERLVLQQRIEQLQSTKHERVVNSRKNDQLLTYKIQKENMSKQLERMRKNVNQITKQKENLQIGSKEKEEAIVKTKQKVVDLLNAVQQHGGMQLYATICSYIE